ncbi:MAG TPA: putative quinol monooxygenase [Oceanobacillus sp.]|nr:putative quinol monooxygenase [Oceanobacillus sp.]
MILVIGRFSIDPAQREAFLTFAREMVDQERQTHGCIAFDIYEDVTTPNAFLMMEQWEDEEVLDAHTSSEEFERNETALNEFIVGEPSWDEYQF